MLQLSPNELFLINRNLVDSASAEVNYVQAVIRDANEAIIDTVNLVDRGDQRFSKTWKVPSDNAYSTGKYITITTRVYSDAGYTTLSGIDGASSETYLIQARWSPLFGASGGGSNMGGGTSEKINYETIKKMCEEAMTATMKKMLPMMQQKEFPMKELVSNIERLIGDIPEVEIPEQKEVDLSPVIKQLDSLPRQIKVVDLSPLSKKIETVQKSIQELPVPEKIDLSPILSEVKNLHSDMVKMQSDFINMIVDAETTRLRMVRDGEKKMNRDELLKGLKLKYGIK